MTKILTLGFIVFTSLSAFAQSRSCEMTSRGNATQIKLISTSSAVLVQLSEDEEADRCTQEASSDFDWLIRCGSGEDATYFGITGTSGRVYEASGTIAQLRKCKLI